MDRVDPFGLVGTVLEARYRVERVVGEGGFGVVYRAIQVSFDEPVAIKVLKLPAHLTAEQRAAVVVTFRAEGKHLRKLSGEHPAFVKALDTGVVEVNGLPAPYLVLEWLEGEPLEQDLRRRRTAGEKGRSLGESMACLAPVVGALAHAHEERVAHRDVKPANIFLVRTEGEPRIKLLDFGMAKVMTETGTEAFNTPTQGGIVGLTPTYAAPEQWQKKLGATGPWTDVYALALVLVEMLTDQPALVGDDLPQLMAATLDPERPTPKARGADVSPEVEAVFLEALAIPPQDRFRSARAFWDALEAAAGGLSKAAVPKAAVPKAAVPDRTGTIPIVLEAAGSTRPLPASKQATSRTAGVSAVTTADHGRTTAPPSPPAPAKQGASSLARVAILGLVAAAGIGAAVFFLRRGPAETPPLLVVTVPVPVVAESAPATTTTPMPMRPRAPRWWDEPLEQPTSGPSPQLPPAKQQWLQLYKRASTLQREKRFADAEGSLRRARDLACKQLGQKDPACLETLQKLAKLLYGMGKLEEAEKALREAILVVNKFGDPQEEGFDDTRQVLILVLLKQGKNDEANKLLKPGEDPLPASAPDASAPDASAPDASAPLRGKRQLPLGWNDYPDLDEEIRRENAAKKKKQEEEEKKKNATKPPPP